MDSGEYGPLYSGSSHGPTLSACYLMADSVSVVRGRVTGWGKGQVVDAEGAKWLMTPFTLSVDQVFKGAAETTATFWVTGAVETNGATQSGPLQTAEGRVSAFFFVRNWNGYRLLPPQGLVWLGADGKYRNPGTYASGKDADAISADIRANVLATETGCGGPLNPYPNGAGGDAGIAEDAGTPVNSDAGARPDAGERSDGGA